MPRLFIAINLPEVVADHLALVQGGVPGARWEARDKLHLTLRFLGELDGGTARAVAEGLAAVTQPRFELGVRGVGHFPPRGEPRSLWAGVDDPTPLHALHDRIERVLIRIGVPADTRKFAPHVTLARLRDAPRGRVLAFLEHHALLETARFEVVDFALMSSVRTAGSSSYRVEQRFPLT